MSEERLVEIERFKLPAVLRMGVGFMPAGLAVDWFRAGHGPLAPEHLPALLAAILAALLIGGSLRFLVRAPVALRATSAGVWFGGGPIIPWREIAAIHDSSQNVQIDAVRSFYRSITFSFHRKRTVLRLPMYNWLSMGIPGQPRVSTARRLEAPAVLVAQLEAMRIAAVGLEDGVIAGSTQPPPARVVQR